MVGTKPSRSYFFVISYVYPSLEFHWLPVRHLVVTIKVTVTVTATVDTSQSHPTGTLEFGTPFGLLSELQKSGFILICRVHHSLVRLEAFKNLRVQCALHER